MDDHALAAHLAAQRWFAGKGRDWGLGGVATLGWLSEGEPAVRVAAVTVAYADGEEELYQLPLAHFDHWVEGLAHAFVAEDGATLGRQTWVYDALHVKEAAGLWPHAVAGETGAGGLRFRRDPTARTVPLDAPPLVVGAEQSNTSVVYGDEAILKVFRRLTPGLSPDIELHAALARAGSTRIAAPLGWVEGTWDHPGADGRAQVEGSLAMLQQFLRNASDGWDLARTSVRDLFAEADLHAEEVGGDFAGESRRLGVATAQVHRDLADVLPTATMGAPELAERARAMRGRLARAAAEVPGLAPHVPGLGATFLALARRRAPLPVQRVHGDYHLGQVMRTLEGWRVIDFEGEPGAPLAQRRALDSPLRDVAGMLRSFDYAARHMLADAAPGTAAQLEYRAAEWAERNKDAFCEGYAKESGWDPRGGEGPGGGSGDSSGDDDETSVALRAFEIDKAVYEVVYEARNRPGWLGIPLAALRRLAAAPLRGVRA